MNIATRIAAVSELTASPSMAQRVARQLTQRNEARKLIASHFNGSAYDAAKAFTSLMNDDDCISLASVLVDQVDFDDPDLRKEAEGILSDIGAHVRGDVG